MEVLLCIATASYQIRLFPAVVKHGTAGYQEWFSPPGNGEKSGWNDIYATFHISTTEVANVNTTSPYNTQM